MWELGPGLHGDDQAILWVRLESAYVSKVPALFIFATFSSVAEALGLSCLGTAVSQLVPSLSDSANILHQGPDSLY